MIICKILFCFVVVHIAARGRLVFGCPLGECFGALNSGKVVKGLPTLHAPCAPYATVCGWSASLGANKLQPIAP